MTSSDTPSAASLSVTLVQAASSLEPADNLAALRDGVAAATGDLVVFPEAFARDFGSPGSDVSPFAEPVEGAFGSELARLAEEHGKTVVAGMFETSDDPERPFNTLVVRGGDDAEYRKIHLYDSFGYQESDRIQAGPPIPVAVSVGGFRVALMTCYDLRFPELARAHSLAGADVLLCPAAWVAGDRKVRHWQTLLAARAIENLAYVVASAQAAPRYCGHSTVVDPRGDVVAEAGDGGPEVITAVVRRELIEEARRENPSLHNRLASIEPPILMG